MSEKIDFSAGLKELEEITNWFESENADLDQGLAKFERGLELITGLRQHLRTAENRVEEIKQKFDAQIQPPEPEDTDAE